MDRHEFKAARERLGLTLAQLGVILGGRDSPIRDDTIRGWEQGKNQLGPSPMACQIMRFMLGGFRPPEWPSGVPFDYGNVDGTIDGLATSLIDCLTYAQDLVDAPGFKPGVVARHVRDAKTALQNAGWKV